MDHQTAIAKLKALRKKWRRESTEAAKKVYGATGDCRERLTGTNITFERCASQLDEVIREMEG